MSAIFKNELSKEQLDELFQSDEKCLEFLADLKWSEGFVCRKCGNTNYCPGKTASLKKMHQMQDRGICNYRNYLS